jgi:uncharacterized protein (DUF1778 family)
MSAKLDIEINLAINSDIWTALEQAAEFNGLRVSQFTRLALCEKLDRENWLRRHENKSPVDDESVPIIPSAA